MGHAISGVALPEKPGKTLASIYFQYQSLRRLSDMSPVPASHPLPLDREALELPEGKPRQLDQVKSRSD